MTDIGDNSVPMAREKVRGVIAEIVQTEREIAGQKTDISEMYKAAKDAGLNVKALRLAVRRSMETRTKREDRQEIEDTADIYLQMAKEGAFSDAD